MTTYHVLFYKTVEGYIEKRAPYRATHIEMLQALKERNEVVVGGALVAPADSALIVFRTAAAAKTFVEHDPYVKNGLISEWQIRPWNVVIGEEALSKNVE